MRPENIDINVEAAPDVDARNLWLPAVEVFTPGATNSNAFLSFSESSEGRRRNFCGRCGIN